MQLKIRNHTNDKGNTSQLLLTALKSTVKPP